MTTDLIVITDEVRSAEKPLALTGENTPRHFAAVLGPLLKPPHKDRENSYVVKNVGDSLMIRVSVAENGGKEITHLLAKILRVREELASGGRDGVDIRVVIAKCDGHICGEDIGKALRAELGEPTSEEVRRGAKLPPPRWPGKEWFDGDMFGYRVAAAFRAASIPKGAEVIVDEGVADLMLAENGITPLPTGVEVEIEATPNGDEVERLFLGPKMAFAPIKGLKDKYCVGKHYLWLREVSAVAEPGNLTKCRQKAKVVTEIWCGAAGDEHVKQCIEEIRQIDNKAEFFPVIGEIVFAHVFDLSEHGESTVAKTLEPMKMGDETPRVLILGAYPELDTYWDVRHEIELRRQQIHGKSRTALVWERSRVAEWEPPLWEFPRRGSMMLLKLKASDATDDPFSDPVCKHVAYNPNLIPGLGFSRCGLLMGDWDAYAVFHDGGSESHLQREFAQELVAASRIQVQKHLCSVVTKCALYACRIVDGRASEGIAESLERGMSAVAK